jgi:uncharacterized protein
VKGEGGPRDLKTGVECLQKAAATGQKVGLYHLAGCYDNGRGVPKDTTRSFELYLQVASTNEVDPLVCSAQYNVGVAYLKGDGAVRDQERAICWFKKAALYGHKGAEMALENLLERS